MRNIFTVILIFCFQLVYSQTLRGKVVDKNSGDGIAFAEIFCLETQIGTVSDVDGNWELENQFDFQITLLVKAIEFDKKLINVENKEKDLVIKLEHSHIHLDEVIVSTSDSKLQRYSVFPVESRKIADLNKNEQTNLVDAMSNIPGIFNFSTGNGIAKPVIRGLSGMRVLTSQNGLRLENQQWGSDHGFAVLNLGIDRVEIIKGPSSLIYGADALGGVIYLADEPYANLNKQEIKASTKLRQIPWPQSIKCPINLQKIIYDLQFMEATFQELIMLLEILKFSTLQQKSLLLIQKIVVVLLKQLLATIKINGLQILDISYYIFKTDFQDIPMIVFGNYLVSFQQIKQGTIPFLPKKSSII